MVSKYFKNDESRETLKGKFKDRETIDLKNYRIAENKDIIIKKISRVMKESAVDCMLFRKTNIITDKLFQRLLIGPFYLAYVWSLLILSLLILAQFFLLFFIKMVENCLSRRTY